MGTWRLAPDTKHFSNRGRLERAGRRKRELRPHQSKIRIRIEYLIYRTRLGGIKRTICRLTRQDHTSCTHSSWHLVV